jgi:hypothetical protein
VVTRLVRKNLMLDADVLREFARRKGTSESEAVREAIKHALAAEEIEEIVREFNRRGGLEGSGEPVPVAQEQE